MLLLCGCGSVGGRGGIIACPCPLLAWGVIVPRCFTIHHSTRLCMVPAQAGGLCASGRACLQQAARVPLLGHGSGRVPVASWESAHGPALCFLAARAREPRLCARQAAGSRMQRPQPRATVHVALQACPLCCAVAACVRAGQVVVVVVGVQARWWLARLGTVRQRLCGFLARCTRTH